MPARASSAMVARPLRLHVARTGSRSALYAVALLLCAASASAALTSTPAFRMGSVVRLFDRDTASSASTQSSDVSVGDPDPHDFPWTPHDGSRSSGSRWRLHPSPPPPLSLLPDIHAESKQDGQSIPEWLKNSKLVGALTSTTQAPPNAEDGLVEGVVVRIAPRFALTSTQHVTMSGLARLHHGPTDMTHFVVFNGDAARVTRVLFESEYYASPTSNLTLIVLELSTEPTGAPLVPVITATPSRDFEFDKLSITNVGSVLDGATPLIDKKRRGNGGVPDLSSSSRLTFFMEPMCGYRILGKSDENVMAELCVGKASNATSNTSASTTSRALRPGDARGTTLPVSLRDQDEGNPAAVNVGIPPNVIGTPRLPWWFNQAQGAALLLYDNELVGLSIPVQLPKNPWAVTKDLKQGFVRLGAPLHRDFIDFATNKTARYNNDEVFDKAAKYPSYLATFIDSSGQKTGCQGVLIAPKFVLTTACCVDEHPDLVAAMFFSADATQRTGVKIASGTITRHPRYVVGDTMYNTAVMELETAVQFAPIQLDDGSTDTSSGELARVQVDNGQCVVSATMSTNDPNSCKRSNGKQFRQTEVLCALSVPAQAAKFTAKDVVGDSTIASFVERTPATTGAALIAVSNFKGVALVGLSVATKASRQRELIAEDSTSTSEVYVRVSNSATFINAYVIGQSWRSSPTKSTIILQDDLPPSEQFVVGLRKTRDGQNFCGGSLVASATVLTAAHCIKDGPANYVSIGSYASSGVESEVIAVVQTAVRVHSHYGSPHQFSFDAAILELEYASAVAPVLLDDSADILDHEVATMYGYGAVSATSGLSPSLRAVSMPLWSQAACQEVFGDEVDDSMLCAGGEKGKDACTGDSGSPLVVNRNGRNVLVGVVSAGSGCGLENVPGVYARVHKIKDFILNRAIGATSESDLQKGGGDATGTDAASSSSSSDAKLTPVPASGNGVGVIQARDANDTATPSSKATNASALSSTSTLDNSPSGYNVDALSLRNLSPLVSRSLMDFLVGSDGQVMFSASVIGSLKDDDNVLRLYSTGDTTALLKIVEKHNSSTLNQRSDRFGRWKTRYADSEVRRCTGG